MVAPSRICQAVDIPKTLGPPLLPLLAQGLPIYLSGSWCARACLAAAEVRQGRWSLLLSLRRRPRPVGASSAAAAPFVVARRTAATKRFDQPLWPLIASSLVVTGPSREGWMKVDRAEVAGLQYLCISEKQILLLKRSRLPKIVTGYYLRRLHFP